MCSKHKLLTFAFVVILFLFSQETIFAQVVINEFSVNPPDRYDWIELYSPDILDISGWKVADEVDDFFTVPDGTSLGPGVYYVLSKYQRLNNDKDSIFLKDKLGNTVDNIRYGYDGEVCIPGTDGSIARIPDGGNTKDRLLVQTKGQTNGDQITDACPVPTSTPTPTPSPTSSPTTASTTTPTPTPTKTLTPTPIKTSTPKPTPSPTETFETPETLVLGLEDKFDKKETSESQKAKKGFPFLPILFIVTGLVCIGAAFFLVFRKSKGYNGTHEENKENS